MEVETMALSQVFIKQEPEEVVKVKEEREEGKVWMKGLVPAMETGEDDGINSMQEDEEEGEMEESEPVEEENASLHQKGLVCSLCGRRYSCLASLRGHLSRQHRVGAGYTCQLCGAVGGTRAAFKRHLLRTHGPDTLAVHHFLVECRHCGKGVTTIPLMYQHIRVDHQELLSQYHLCRQCPGLFTTRPGLNRHYKRRHKGLIPPPADPLPCPSCEVELPSSAALREHQRTHHSEPLHHLISDPASTSVPCTGFSCDSCPAIFTCKSYLVRHVKKVHQSCPRPQSYRCGECGREYRQKGRLQRHISAHHPAPGHHPLYPCHTCSKTFNTYEKRKNHLRRAHRDRSMWQCGECHRSFLTASDLDIHRHARHKGSCPVCGKVFLRRDSLREHLLIHNGPRLPCPHCSKTFTQGSNLKRHIRIHTGEKPYKCTYCHKPFGDRSACKSHMLVHTGEGRCSCPTCGATFSKRQKLTYHMRLHTGQGLLHCPLCSRPATNTYDLKKHLETHQVALLTSLRGSLTYGDLEDLPKLALKALHNLVWVAVQNSQREKIEDDAREDKLSATGEDGVSVQEMGENGIPDSMRRENESTKELRRGSVSDGMERIDWSCIGVTVKTEEMEGRCDKPRLRYWKKGKRENLRKFRKHTEDSGSANDSMIMNGLEDLKLEQLNVGVMENNNSEREGSRQCSDDSYKFVSDDEELESSPTKNPKQQKPKNIRNQRKVALQSKKLKRDEQENGVEGSKKEKDYLHDTVNSQKQPLDFRIDIEGWTSQDIDSKINKVKDKLPQDIPDPKINRCEDRKPQEATPTIAPMAVLTQVMQFILGSLSTPRNTNATTSHSPSTTPTLGDQLVERCLQVIMRDGEEDGHKKGEENSGDEKREEDDSKMVEDNCWDENGEENSGDEKEEEHDSEKEEDGWEENEDNSGDEKKEEDDREKGEGGWEENTGDEKEEEDDSEKEDGWEENEEKNSGDENGEDDSEKGEDSWEENGEENSGDEKGEEDNSEKREQNCWNEKGEEKGWDDIEEGEDGSENRQEISWDKKGEENFCDVKGKDNEKAQKVESKDGQENACDEKEEETGDAGIREEYDDDTDRGNNDSICNNRKKYYSEGITNENISYVVGLENDNNMIRLESSNDKIINDISNAWNIKGNVQDRIRIENHSCEIKKENHCSEIREVNHSSEIREANHSSEIREENHSSEIRGKKHR